VTAAPLRVAVLGAGTVGEQVVRRLLDGRTGRLAADDGGTRLELAGVAVRDVGRAVARGLPEALLTDAPAHLVAARDTDVVVELMGGDEPARTLVVAALGAGKPVVTANKHLLAHHGAELETAARRTGASLRFEAAVGGGIPVLAPLAGDLAANDVTRVRGIVNGTTNYILSEMAAGRGTYGSVLREAQAQGYAEADPSGDVEGRDAVNKLVVLARLAWDRWRDPDEVVSCPRALRGPGRPGITGVTSEELAGATALGLAIRLLATADADGAAGVVPTALPAESPLGATGGVRNRIEVRGEPVGDVGFDGPGAGGPATSSAVLGDLFAIARGVGSTWAGRPPAGREEARAETAAPEVRVPWFTLLPGVSPGDVMPDEAVVAHAAVPGGLAIRTTPMTAREAATVLGSLVPDRVDAALYPVHD
jgi:homoserine dehydrogenase